MKRIVLLAAVIAAASPAILVPTMSAMADEVVETKVDTTVESGGEAGPSMHRHAHHARHVRSGCGCRHAVRVHRRYRRVTRVEDARGYGRVVPAASLLAFDPWKDRPVDGRMITPPIPGLIHDHDATADYLGKGGTSAPVLHLPSQRGVIDR